VAAGGISALVHSLQEGSSRAKAAAVELLLGFAMDGVDNQEWIGAAPGAIPSLVDMLRCQLPSRQGVHSNASDASMSVAQCLSGHSRKRSDGLLDRTWCV